MTRVQVTPQYSPDAFSQQPTSQIAQTDSPPAQGGGESFAPAYNPGSSFMGPSNLTMSRDAFNAGPGYQTVNNALQNQGHQESVNTYRGYASGLGNEAMNNYYQSAATPQPAGDGLGFSAPDYGGTPITGPETPTSGQPDSPSPFNAYNYDETGAQPNSWVRDALTRKGFDLKQKVGAVSGLLDSIGSGLGFSPLTEDQKAQALQVGGGGSSSRDQSILPTKKPVKPKPKPKNDEFSKSVALDFEKWAFPKYNSTWAFTPPKPYP